MRLDLIQSIWLAHEALGRRVFVHGILEDKYDEIVFPMRRILRKGREQVNLPYHQMLPGFLRALEACGHGDLIDLCYAAFADEVEMVPMPEDSAEEPPAPTPEEP